MKQKDPLFRWSMSFRRIDGIMTRVWVYPYIEKGKIQHHITTKPPKLSKKAQYSFMQELNPKIATKTQYSRDGIKIGVHINIIDTNTMKKTKEHVVIDEQSQIRHIGHEESHEWKNKENNKDNIVQVDKVELVQNRPIDKLEQIFAKLKGKGKIEGNPWKSLSK